MKLPIALLPWKFRNAGLRPAKANVSSPEAIFVHPAGQEACAT
jgi:hypothetical protein